MKCPVCNGNWSNTMEACEDCKITRMAIELGPSRMRRISKRFRYTTPVRVKKVRKHGRSAPAPSRVVMKRRPLRGSVAAQLARRQADTLRAGARLPETGERVSAPQDDIGRDS